ncbi:MAG: FMN-binding protein [Coriobacteriales bacterium]|jgi:major membrane immunogen (membrane-anchored lipoprotein)|nr:FMN-binding protein [Coriobacteriales bacterium]
MMHDVTVKTRSKNVGTQETPTGAGTGRTSGAGTGLYQLTTRRKAGLHQGPSRRNISLKSQAISIILSVVFMVVMLVGCKDTTREVTLRDGTFSGFSSEDDTAAYGEVTVTIQDNKITDCRFVTWQADGSIKDIDYGKVNGVVANQDYYDKAQLAVEAMKQYAQQLVQAQDLEGVDVIAGATIAYNQFNEAVDAALAEAKK